MAQLLDGRWVVSPQDVVAQFECAHKVVLSAAVRSGALEWTDSPDEGLDLLRAMGIAHEQRRLKALPQEWRVKRLSSPPASTAAYEAAWQSTLQAMEDECDAIYQATLLTDDFVGIADFLVVARDDHGEVLRDAAGVAVYEPVDTKSARSAKRGAALQVGAYAEALVRLGRPMPQRVHLWLAGDNDWSAPALPLIALAREAREQVAARIARLGDVPSPAWAAPREACARCRFADLCDEGRHEARDLSIVQEIRSTTRQRLVDAGFATIDALAVAADADRPSRVAAGTFERLRAQAALQVAGEAAGRVIWEVVDPAELQALPVRTLGDLWFDMEGDPYAFAGAGLEYMFGFGFLTAGEFDFDTTDAIDRAGERKAFEDFIDLVTERWAEHPGMHVYHYADYEKRALRMLAQRHGTREREVDDILRAGLLVDLYTVVRRALRVSTESLSLKKIEAAYDVTHAGEAVSSAMDSVIAFERVLDLQAEGKAEEAAAAYAGIRSYNRLDCESTMKLDDWLRTLVPGAGTGAGAYRPAGEGDDDAPGMTGPYDALIAELEGGLPADPAERDDEQKARALLSAAIQYHDRERRPAWWKLFELITGDGDGLDRASDVLVVDSAEASDWHKPPRAHKYRRTITVRGQDEDPRNVLEPGAQAFTLYDDAPEGMASPAGSSRGFMKVKVEGVDAVSADLQELQGRDGETWDDLPIAVLPGPPVNAKVISDAIATVAASTFPSANLGAWHFPEAAWADLLLARPPRNAGGSLPRTGDSVRDVIAALRDSVDSYVAVQGPPGTGKTYVGSRAVAALAEAGWKIGVVAQSHAVVENFLDAVAKADPAVAIGKEPATGKPVNRAWHLPPKSKVEDWAAGQPAGFVIGGTAWTFSRGAVRDLGLDLMVIDEAGQFALSNAIACTAAARTCLLLGDPQQLPQVSQASHPESIEQSVLERVIARHATMPADRGYFLNETYRMHPALTRAVSWLQYEGRLDSAPVTRMRALQSVRPGVIPTPVDHDGNTTSSPEEADRVLVIVRDLMGTAWTGAMDHAQLASRPLTQDDIIVVAAYNAQTRLLRRVLTDAGLPDVQVGTVDKFQGREAVIVIVSMATSSDEDLPRGIEFLLSPNRLNVAISRAQWACYLVHSPALLEARPPSVDGMQRLGGFLELVRDGS